MKRLCTAAILSLSLVSFAHGQSNLLDGTDPKGIFEIARGFGSAELDKDRDGDPKISGRIEGIRYSVYFYGCKSGQSCKTIQFSASWSAPGQFTVERLNDYNRDKRFGKVYLDKEGDPVIQYDVNLFGGVTGKNLEDTFDWWKTILVDFSKQVK